ncbi:MAG TPA: APC family permease [Thermoanaerobaculia bacterium]|nr:APC family permease [Thermoanaerobaculia bacterium]
MTDQPSGKLVRTVGAWGLVAMCINAVVGSGVFLLPSESYKLLGPFSLWIPLIAVIPVFILVLCFAEASSHFTEPGGAYLYARTAFGDFIGFETGWMNWLARVTSLASLSNGFVLALARLFPELGTGAPRAGVIFATIAILALIHLLGVRYGAASIYIFTAGKLIPLTLFIIVALIAWKHNPIPGSLQMSESMDLRQAWLFVLFAYAGFENLGVPAGEYKNPRRDLPRALLLGILAIGALYSLSQLAAMSALPDLSKTSTPIADAAFVLVGTAGAVIITVGSLLSMAGTNSGTMLEGSRMLYALSLGRARMSAISYVHPRFRTPTLAILIHSSVALGLALGGTFAKLALLSAIARLTTYLFTCLAVPRLRRLNEGFRTPGLVVPVLGTIISLASFLCLNRFQFIAAALAMTVGAMLYAVTRTSTHTPQP